MKTNIFKESTESSFDEAAFQDVRRNLQSLVNVFNELSDLTGQGPLQVERKRPL
jgi:hypothetical protein